MLCAQNPTSKLIETYNGSWNNSFLETYHYDANHYLINIDSKLWEDTPTPSHWSNSNQLLYENHADGKVYTETYVVWTDNAWLPSRRKIYTYTSSGEIASTTEQRYTNNSWQNDKKETFQYDVNDFKIYSIYQRWINNTWMDISQRFFSNNPDGRPDHIIQDIWDSINNEWDLSGQYLYSYDGNVTTYTRQGWNGEWINSERNITTTDAEQNILQFVLQSWENEAWNSDVTQTYTYDAISGNLIEVLFESLPVNTWIPYKRFTYQYENLGVQQQSAEHCTIFPNPCINKFTINMKTDFISNFILTDQNGKEIEKGILNAHETSVNTVNLETGMYYLRINNNQAIKIVKQ
jgi:hypothetical protein